jgi:predicted transcriptional regulator of viral defense system
MRQKSLLFHAIQHPDSIYTIRSQGTTYSVSYETARSDLLRLEKRGLLNRVAEGREFHYRPSDHLFELLRSGLADIQKEQAVRLA